MKIGIILAAGVGSRIKIKNKNKTTLELKGKSLVQYGVELFEKTVDETIVVVGAYGDSVRESIESDSTHFVKQAKRLGTGHALKVAIKDIQDRKIKPERIFVGYGDHMMFYKPSVITEMDKLHNKDRAAVTLVTVVHDDPNSLAWGRIIRNNVGTVEAIVEQNDATESQKEITELNAGFYCFDYQFLLRNINKLQKSPVTGEYYITDLIELAIKNKLPVVAHLVPFKLVGIGINTRAQLVDASEML